MNRPAVLPSRRRFLAAAGAGLATGAALLSQPDERRRLAESDRALIAVTLDLEMSRNFPAWDDTHWDYDKGNLNAETKRYTTEACRRVRGHGGVIHCFVLGRTLEQEDVGWLRDIARAGHPLGNHTYDHVNVTATRLEDVQFRFRRAPWLVEGRAPRAVIADNVRLTAAAMRGRLGVAPVGFRTPGGFRTGLADRADVRQMLRDQGYTWVSSQYPAHRMSPAGTEPDAAVFDSIVVAQGAAQPFRYPDGLIEIPMSPVSDVNAFRTGRWRLDSFLRAIRRAVEWAIDRRAVFDFLAHPSCLYVTDPEFRAVGLICDLVRRAGDRAALTDLETVAQRVRHRE